MEEKERYKWSQDAIEECAYEDYDYIVDTENNIIFDDDNYFKLVDLLNQKDKRIKKLEEQEETYAKFSSYQFEENKLRYNKLNKELTEQIQELQEKLHILNEQSQNNYYIERYTEALKENNQLDKRIEELEEENQQLKQQLAITGKALQMACETLQDINFKLYNTEMNFDDYFKQQAKEMLENE